MKAVIFYYTDHGELRMHRIIQYPENSVLEIQLRSCLCNIITELQQESLLLLFFMDLLIGHDIGQRNGYLRTDTLQQRDIDLFNVQQQDSQVCFSITQPDTDKVFEPYGLPML